MDDLASRLSFVMEEGAIASDASLSLANTSCAVPSEVRISNGRLEWRLKAPSEQGYRKGIWENGKSAKGVLFRFASLADASDDEILTFAGKFGVLGICEDGLPGIHNSCKPRMRRPNNLSKELLEVEESDSLHFRSLVEDWHMKYGYTPWYWEQLSSWRTLARRLDAVLTISILLRDGERTSINDWRTFWPDDLSEERARKAGYWPISEPKKRIGQRVTEWLSWAGLRPAISWLSDSPKIVFPVAGTSDDHDGSERQMAWPRNSLFPILIASLVVVLTSSRGHVKCGHCGKNFEPESDRKPRYDRKYSCSELCRKEIKRIQKLESFRRCRGRGK